MSREQYLICVIGTEMHNIEQQRILQGIIEQAQEENAVVSVLSNLFNPFEPELADCTENRIFDLIRTEKPDALIMLSETFVNTGLRDRICNLLRQQKGIPLMLAGTGLPGAIFPSITTNDTADIEQITRHLIEVHGFRDIALLTGPQSLEVTQLRTAGYRRALEANGIPYDASKVYEGDFWYYSGDLLAKAFLCGEKPMPEALVCENDYMAFGVLDAFDQAGVNIIEKMAVTGYEFIPDRILHTPLLTTCQRNRTEIGRIVVRLLMQQVRGERQTPFRPPQGSLIHGMTCPCQGADNRQHSELVAARTEKKYADWYLKAEMERMMTECRDMDAFAEAMGNYMYLLRGVSDILLCLYEDWHRPDPESDVLLCRSVNTWTDHTVFRLRDALLSGIAARCDHTAAYYWLPLCFADRLFGYCVLRYDKPDGYDDICRSWIKTVANGLEFLRLKADVRYLLQCRVLSGAYDSMTGMFSREGLKNACRLMQNTAGASGLTAVLFRYLADRTAMHTADEAKSVTEKLLAAAQAVQQFHSGICGRISEYEFLLIFPANQVRPQIIQFAVTAELITLMPVSAFLCTADEFPNTAAPDSLFQTLTESADRIEQQISASRMLPHNNVLTEIRTAVYQSPAKEKSIEQNAALLDFNPDYFNRNYKERYGLSYHQDCIRSRVLYAAHLLMQTALTITETAEHCGYTESKYFIRQFSSVTDCPPKAFRTMIAKLTGTDTASGEDAEKSI